ncbi:MAG: hypothetical protein AAF654_12520 [Myxococcota bacterium]
MRSKHFRTSPVFFALALVVGALSPGCGEEDIVPVVEETAVEEPTPSDGNGSGGDMDPPPNSCEGETCSGNGECVLRSDGSAACVCDAGFTPSGLACVAIEDDPDPDPDPGPGVTEPSECGTGAEPALLASLPGGVLVGGGGTLGDRRPLRRIGDEVVVELEYPDSGVRLEKLSGNALFPVTPFTRFTFSFYGDHRSSFVLVADDTLTLSSNLYRTRVADVRTGADWISITPERPARPGQFFSDPYVSTEDDLFVWLEDSADGALGGLPFRIYTLDASTGALDDIFDFGNASSPGAYLGQPDGQHHWHNATGTTLTHWADANLADSFNQVVGTFVAAGERCRWTTTDRDASSYYLSGTCDDVDCGPSCTASRYYILRMPFSGGNPEPLWEEEIRDIPANNARLRAGPYVDEGGQVYFAFSNFSSGSQVNPHGIVEISKTGSSSVETFAGSAPLEFAVGPNCIVQLNDDSDELVGWPR